MLRGEVEVTAGPECDQLGFIGKGGFFGEKTVVEAVRCEKKRLLFRAILIPNKIILPRQAWDKHRRKG
eukprot:COSAG06_NODE_2777_length_6300_cov_38.831963_5_plen_68_part_00